MQNQCAEIKIRAERRAGELIPEQIEHGGDRKTESRFHDATLKDLDISESRLRVDRKSGEWSIGLEPGAGKRTDLTSSHAGTKLEFYKEIDIPKSEMYRKEAIASVPEKEFEEHIAKRIFQTS